jgi:hypothetical protein
MHGIIFAELKKYVEFTLGAPAWPALLSQAGLASKMYLTMHAYPDSELLALVTTACKVTGHPMSVLLEDFGAFIVPQLLQLYGSLLDKKWKTLDVVEHAENTIHRVVRLRDPAVDPPKLSSSRASANETVVVYTSSRKMCALAKGIIRGLGTHFGETIVVSEVSCMLEGAMACTILARQVRGAGHRASR